MSDITFVNWPSEIEMSHSWKTGIQKAITGKEKRSALFSWPRVTVDYKHITVEAVERIWFSNNLYLYAGKDHVWSIPIFSDACQLSSDAASGQVVINTVEDCSKMHFLASRYAVLFSPNSYSSYEVIQISSTAANIVNAVSTLSSTWQSESTYIAPLFDMILNSSEVEIKRTEDEVSTIPMSFKESFFDPLAHTYVASPYTPATYAGIAIFPDSGIQKNHDLSFKGNAIFGDSLGLGYALDYFDETELDMGFKFLLSDRDSMSDLRGFFDSQMGRYGDFWIPTFDRDIRLTSSVGSSDVILNVSSVDDYTNVYGSNTFTGRYIKIWTPSGNSYNRKIESSTSGTITISSSLGESVTEFSKCRISIMHYVRFYNDDFIYKLKGPWVAKGSFRVKILQGESAPN